MDKGTIIYAEDREEIRMVYERIIRLNFPDYDLEYVVSGLDLWKRLERGADGLSLVVTDNSMLLGPKGIQIIEEYAQREDFRHVPFILFSADDIFLGEEAVKRGAYSFIQKGSDISEIVAVLRNALNHK